MQIWSEFANKKIGFKIFKGATGVEIVASQGLIHIGAASLETFFGDKSVKETRERVQERIVIQFWMKHETSKFSKREKIYFISIANLRTNLELVSSYEYFFP